MELSEYLLSRGLSLDPAVIEGDYDAVMSNEALLQEAAELWTAHKGLITAILQARINALGRQILIKAIPQEVIVLRQAVVEVGALTDDFEKYKGEWERRKAPDKPAEDAPTEVVSEGKEGSV